MIRVDYSKAVESIGAYAGELTQAHAWLQEATGRGNDYVGWVNLPRDYDKAACVLLT